MSFRAFIDDSSQDDETFVLAGHVASGATWEEFSKDWAELLPLGRLNKEGTRRFKMSEVPISPNGIWTVRTFYKLLEKHNIVSVASCIRKSHLRAAQENIYIPYLSMGVERPLSWGILNNIYLILFRMIMEGFNSEKTRNIAKIPIDAPVNFTYDEQAEKFIVTKAWAEYVASRPPRLRRLFGSTPKYDRDENSAGLQAADLWAWWAREKLYPNKNRTKDQQNLIAGLLKEIETSNRTAIYFVMDESKISKSLAFFAREKFSESTKYNINYLHL